MQTKKISHPCGCCEFACGRIIRWGKRSWADTNIKVLLMISRYKASQGSAIVSGLLTKKGDLRSCFCVLTMRHRRGQCEWGSLWNSELILNQLEDPVEDILLVSFYSVSSQMISQEMNWSDHCLGLSNLIVPVSRRSTRETEYDTLRLPIFYHQWNWRRIRL